MNLKAIVLTPGAPSQSQLKTHILPFTTMPFPNDPHWLEVRSFLEQQAQPTDAILAPNDFLEFFPGTYHYQVAGLLPLDHFKFVVFHKGMVADIAPIFALNVIHQFQPIFANGVFVVYAPASLSHPLEFDWNDVAALIEQVEADDNRFVGLASDPNQCAIVITTSDRPDQLARSLTQIAALKAPILIVDDGSQPNHHQANQQIAQAHQATLLHIPEKRGIANALNVGINYWLASPDVTWISWFQAGVEVHPNILNILATVQDAHTRPLLTGWDAPEHALVKTEDIAGQSVLYKRSTPGDHLHAHRDYWQAVLPIPTPYWAAKGDKATDADWWITAWSPNSILKKGGYVACVPGLVQRSAVVESAGAIAPEPVVSVTKQPKEVAPPSTGRLAGVKVLIDGYNLQLSKGTGIKTYGVSLMQALKTLGADVDVLLSRKGYKADDILDEVLFFDDPGDPTLMTVVKGLIKTASGPLYRARRRKPPSNLVVTRGQFNDDFLKYASSFNLPQCYDVANALYKKLRLSTAISVPEKIDIWHATYPLPMTIRGAKKITTIHDLIPLRLPYTTLDDKESFYFKIRDSLKDSDVTIAVSENSKQDILTYFDVDPDRIVVTYQPIALPPLTASEEEVTFFLKRYGLAYQKYFLFVGAIEPKKNVGRLIDAYATMETDMPLVIIGKKGWLWEDELGKLAYLFNNDDTSGKRVQMLEYVSVDSLRYFYRGAYYFVFPSLYEGFGLPPIEAMNFGCPVITSNVSCLPEICKDAALYVDPYNVRDIKEKLETAQRNPTLREQKAIAGLRVAKSFSMANYLDRLSGAYAKALGG
jgi:glycosyltransferase involved in cell wall biosynthesis